MQWKMVCALESIHCYIETLQDIYNLVSDSLMFSVWQATILDKTCTNMGTICYTQPWAQSNIREDLSKDSLLSSFAYSENLEEKCIHNLITIIIMNKKDFWMIKSELPPWTGSIMVVLRIWTVTVVLPREIRGGGSLHV